MTENRRRLPSCAGEEMPACFVIERFKIAIRAGVTGGTGGALSELHP